MISIIITTKNEDGVIGDLLKSIKLQSYADYEIVLVDNFSTDETRQITKKFGARVFTKGPERSVQRNYGVGKSLGKYVLILDADMVLTKNVLRDCMSLMNKDKNLGGLTIPEKSFGEGFWVRFKIFEREFYVGEESIEAARFFKKSIFQKFGGYDINITGPEDYDLPLRMKKVGVGIGKIESYMLHNERKFSPWESAKKKYYYASHARIYLKKHPETIMSQGNFIFRPVFFKKWKKLLSHPFLSFGMFIIKGIEMMGALLGVIYSIIWKLN